MRPLLLSVILTCWGWITPCWSATITVTMPDEQLDRAISEVCRLGIWPASSLKHACALGERHVKVEAMLNIALPVGSAGALKSLEDLQATVEVTPSPEVEP